MRGDAWTLDHFEASLLIAQKLFERHRLRWAVIETGMGGRYDPATALEVVATVVTNVGQDHEESLGAEHWQRAVEKAGICRPGVPLFSADQDDRTIGVLREVCRDVGAPYHLLAPKDTERMKRLVTERGKPNTPDRLLFSEHQMVNAALAARVVDFVVGGESLERLLEGFLAARFVGRFWKIEEGV